LIFICPILVLFFLYVFKLKLTVNQFIYLIIVAVITIISSAIEGFFIENFLFSLYLLFPLFILITSKSKAYNEFTNQYYFHNFFSKFTILLAIVNVSAFIYSQFLITGDQNFEDSFTGLYGSSGFGSHTLSIINLMVSVYYFYSKKYFKFMLFLICGILGFYGLGLMVFLLAFFLVFLSNLYKYWRTFAMVVLSGLMAAYSLYIFNPENFRYLEKNINYAQLVIDDYSYEKQMKTANDTLITRVPRFITFLDGSQKRFFNDPKVFLIGTSPGGYNSRVAFYFNGDFMKNKFIKNNFNNRTEYHKEDIFPLLNRKYIERPYNDGTRNQTFSSLVSILLEYGFFVGGIFLFWFFSKIRRIRKKLYPHNKAQSQYVKFLGYFMFFLLLVQNYFEYSEIIFPILILIKLMEIDHYNTIFDEPEQ
jgi:hypothetical protein